MVPLFEALLKAKPDECQRLKKDIDRIKSAHAINSAVAASAAASGPDRGAAASSQSADTRSEDEQSFWAGLSNLFS